MGMHSNDGRRAWSSGGVACLVLAASPAFAQASDPQAAERAFQEGRRLLDARDFAAACPKFAESYRLDAATGTLLALAMCHEGQGKTATAWGEYRKAAERARAEQRPDREQAALEWAHEVEAKLCTLTVVIPSSVAATPGLSAHRDGTEIPRAEWSTPVALDPGEHTVAVRAPGKKPWNATIALGPTADRRTLTVHLVDEPGAESQETGFDFGKLTVAQKAGIGAAAAGVVVLGVGTFFGIRAVRRDDQSDPGCDGNACDPDAKQLRLDAREDGDRATVAFVAGGVLLAGGAGLFFFGQGSGSPRAHVRAVPLVGAREAGVAVGGRF